MTTTIHIDSASLRAPSPFKAGDPVILIHDQPTPDGPMAEMPRGCIGYVTETSGHLTAVDFGGWFETIWCDAKNLTWADADYVAEQWRRAGREPLTP